MHINEELSIKAMTINQIYSLYVAKKLIVNRKYQRKLCWTIEEKRNFIDTISNGYPVPLFLLAVDDDGNYEIIDGMQRLDAICTLIEQRYELLDGYFNLESMPDTLALKRSKILKQKKETIDLEKCKEIANYPLPVSIFSSKDNSIEEVFKRINSTGKHLSPQELRQIGVNTDYANIVRQISSEIRGDSSDDILLLNNMSNISLSNYRLPYTINVNDIFWIKNEIFPSNDLRQSRDEEVIGFILANIILGGKIFYQGNQLNKFYGYTRNPLSVDTPIEMTKLQNGIDRVGIENVKNQFYSVMSCIKDVIAYSQKSFRRIINADKSISDITLQFQIIFMAIYRLIVKEGKNIYNSKIVFEKINGNCNNLTSSDLRNDKSILAATDMVYGLIESAFENGKGEDPAIDDWSMKCVNIINRSRTEQILYDFKIGFVEYKGTELNKNTLEKVLKTLTAINNVGPKKTGYVLIGVGDKEEDAKKYAELYDVDYILEGSFPVIGVDHDAKALNLSLDRYTHCIKEYIKNCKSIPDEYREHLIKNMRAPLLYGKQLIIFKTCYSQPVTYKNEYYTREFTDVVKIDPPKYPQLFNEYYKKIN
ncbi:MAG: DUF262 domain-containing protein [Clostridia bacterium]